MQDAVEVDLHLGAQVGLGIVIGQRAAEAFVARALGERQRRVEALEAVVAAAVRQVVRAARFGAVLVPVVVDSVSDVREM